LACVIDSRCTPPVPSSRAVSRSLAERRVSDGRGMAELTEVRGQCKSRFLSMDLVQAHPRPVCFATDQMIENSGIFLEVARLYIQYLSCVTYMSKSHVVYDFMNPSSLSPGSLHYFFILFICSIHLTTPYITGVQFLFQARFPIFSE